MPPIETADLKGWCVIVCPRTSSPCSGKKIAVRVLAVESAGLWVEEEGQIDPWPSEVLARANVHPKGFVGMFPAFFLPFSSIEWLHVPVVHGRLIPDAFPETDEDNNVLTIMPLPDTRKE